MKTYTILLVICLLAAPVFSEDTLQDEETKKVLEKAREKYDKKVLENAQEDKEQTEKAEVTVKIILPEENVVTVVEAEKIEPEYQLISIDMMPGLSGNDKNAYTVIALGALNSEAAGIAGFQAAGLFASSGNVQGMQAAGISTTALDINGFQSSGIIATARDIKGAQASGIIATARDVRGGQAAGIIATAKEVDGVQVAGIMSSATNVKGFQSSGIINTAKNVNGAQIAGIINIADEVRGLQLGLININKKVYGVSIGLLTISENGIFDIKFGTDELKNKELGLQTGSEKLYTYLYALVPAEAEFDWASLETAMYGISIGSRSGKKLYTDLEIGTRMQPSAFVVPQTTWDWISTAEDNPLGVYEHAGLISNALAASQVLTLRASVGASLFGSLGVWTGYEYSAGFAGVPINLLGTNNPSLVTSEELFGEKFSVFGRWLFGISL